MWSKFCKPSRPAQRCYHDTPIWELLIPKRSTDGKVSSRSFYPGLKFVQVSTKPGSIKQLLSSLRVLAHVDSELAGFEILCKLEHAHIPSHLKHQLPRLAQPRSRTPLPVCGDTYPWIFLLLRCSTDSLRGQACTLCVFSTHAWLGLPVGVLPHELSVSIVLKEPRIRTRVTAHSSFFPSSILFLPFLSWTAELALFNLQLAVHMFGGEGGWMGMRDVFHGGSFCNF